MALDSRIRVKITCVQMLVLVIALAIAGFMAVSRIENQTAQAMDSYFEDLMSKSESYFHAITLN